MNIPSPLSQFQVHQSVFTCTPTTVFLAVPSRHQLVQGASTKPSRLEAGRAAVGELMERYVMGTAPLAPFRSTLPGYSLTAGQIADVPIEDVYFWVLGRNGQPQAADSMGAASHVTSEKAIEAAWLEFIERQSLIYHWLTRTSGNLIPFQLLSTQTLRRLAPLRNFFDEVLIVDISLHPAVCVAVVMGFGTRFMGIGVAAHWNTSDAVDSAMREVFAQLIYYSPWCARGRRTPFSTPSFDSIYAKNYYENYAPLSLRNDIEYLASGDPLQRNEPGESPHGAEMLEVIADVCQALRVKPVIVHLPNRVEGSPFRMVKMFSHGGYPHMRCDVLVPEDYPISFHRGLTTFPNRARLIPFP